MYLRRRSANEPGNGGRIRPDYVGKLCNLTESNAGWRRQREPNRLQVLPGVTGLAQINLPADTDFESTRAKLALDLQYIERATPGLDARIALRSALRMLGIRK